MAELQPYKPGFWARDYDPTQARWKDTESELGGYDVDLRAPPDVEAVMPDIRGTDLHTPPGPPGEAAWRMGQQVPSILQQAAQYNRDTMPPVVSALSADAVVPSLRETEQRAPMDNWRVNTEHQTQKDLLEPHVQTVGPEFTMPLGAPDVDKLYQGVTSNVGSDAESDAKKSYYTLQEAAEGDAGYAELVAEIEDLAEDNLKIVKGEASPAMLNTVSGIQRVIDLVSTDSGFLPRGPLTEKKYPDITTWGNRFAESKEGDPYIEKQRMTEWLEGLERKSWPSGVNEAGETVYSDVPGLEPADWTRKDKYEYMISRLGGHAHPSAGEGGSPLSRINIEESERFPFEIEWHEQMHHVSYALARTERFWDEIEVDGKKFIDIIYPKGKFENGQWVSDQRSPRVWDRELLHAIIYSAALYPEFVSRVETMYGGGTQMNPTIFSEFVEPHELKGKLKLARRLLSSYNEAANNVADAYEGVIVGKFQDFSKGGAWVPWHGEGRRTSQVSTSPRQEPKDRIAFYMEN